MWDAMGQKPQELNFSSTFWLVIRLMCALREETGQPKPFKDTIRSTRKLQHGVSARFQIGREVYQRLPIYLRCTVNLADPERVVGTVVEISDDWYQARIFVHLLNNQRDQLCRTPKRHTVRFWIDENNGIASEADGIEECMCKSFLAKQKITGFYCRCRKQTSSTRIGRPD